MPKRQSYQSAVPAAQQYVEEQLKTMRRRGAVPDLSSKRYNQLVEKVARATYVPAALPKR